MLNKSELKLMERVLEGSIELKMELYKAIGEDLLKVQQQIATLMGQPVQQNVVEDVKPVMNNNDVVEAAVKDTQVVQETKENNKGEDKIENKDSARNVKANHKVSDVKKLVNCGKSEGDDAVLFVEKRRDSKHLWYGQIRINNYVRNFHWSNELDMPVVYGIESVESLRNARELIRNAVVEISPKELTLYDEVLDHPDFGGFHGRQYLGALHQGAYIYLTPETDGDNIVAKGYTNGHAFIVRNDGEVFWRNYNYIFSKKPFESTPSKGFDTATLVNNVELLYDAAVKRFEKLSSAYHRTTAVKSVDTTKSAPSSVEDALKADLGGLM